MPAGTFCQEVLGMAGWVLGWEEPRLDRAFEQFGDLDCYEEFGSSRPVSVALTVWRDTSRRSARSA